MARTSSRIFFQMILVISSPSSSTTGFFTLILSSKARHPTTYQPTIHTHTNTHPSPLHPIHSFQGKESEVSTVRHSHENPKAQSGAEPEMALKRRRLTHIRRRARESSGEKESTGGIVEGVRVCGSEGCPAAGETDKRPREGHHHVSVGFGDGSRQNRTGRERTRRDIDGTWMREAGTTVLSIQNVGRGGGRMADEIRPAPESAG